jgi:catechol 2,3-dioxygenase-like lactoylglutathione lyase family enzyme
MHFLRSFSIKTLSIILRTSATTIMLVCVACTSHVQEGELPSTDGVFFAISVRNIDEAVNWYTKHLGFKVVSQGENDHRKGALLSRPGVVLELGEFVGAISLEELRQGLESHLLYGIFKIGFTTEDIDKTFKSLEEANVEVFFPIVRSSDGNRTFGIKDLEGNIIQFYGK